MKHFLAKVTRTVWKPGIQPESVEAPEDAGTMWYYLRIQADDVEYKGALTFPSYGDKEDKAIKAKLPEFAVAHSDLLEEDKCSEFVDAVRKEVYDLISEEWLKKF